MKHESQAPSPQTIWEEYTVGRRFKAGLGEHGMYEQNRRNERFFIGDQWHGARCGGERPLVRHNVIKRIGDYKMSVIGSTPLSVSFSADGVPNTVELKEQADRLRTQLRQQQADGTLPDPTADTGVPAGETVELVMTALSDYFDTTAERLRFEEHKDRVLRDAYISGTAFLYTYWDPTVKTGLYADLSRKTAITGDLAIETLDVENVYLGDPNRDDIQTQPYILIAQRKRVSDLQKAARKAGMSASAIEAIRPDSELFYMAGDRSQDEPYASRKATVITRFWKERGADGYETVKAIQVCQNAVIRPVWDTGIRLYPLAMFHWERRKGCGYGDSEITYLIPNQIAINRMITASVWAVMMMGVPITVVNGDVVQQPVTNDPGQVLRVFGTPEDVAGAVHYVSPPSFSSKFDENIASLITNTLKQSGANDAALGDIRPDNTSAIIAVREAATMPLQITKNRFYRFIADIAHIWAEFWVMKYGARCLKVTDEQGSWYLPFDGKRYRDFVINVKVEVGASTLWGESQTVATLDNLLSHEIIDPVQYVSRLPHGVLPQQQSLLREMRERADGSASNEAEAAPTTAESTNMADDRMTDELVRQILSGEV
ncbi:MAG: hypothetical protein IJU16_05315 [Clostridia bacterium]|nr:hypothetical protein [Clostridia bacterium]